MTERKIRILLIYGQLATIIITAISFIVIRFSAIDHLKVTLNKFEVNVTEDIAEVKTDIKEVRSYAIKNRRDVSYIKGRLKINNGGNNE